MSKKTTKQVYLKMVQKCLLEIGGNPRPSKERFLFLKSKAEKWLKKAKDLESRNQ